MHQSGSEIKYNWAELKRDWLAGKYHTYKEMAKLTGVSLSTLTKRAWREGWFKHRKKVEANTELKVEEKIAKMAASKYAQIIERHLKYADILLALGFNSFKGKKKIRSEANALSSIRLGLETQRRAVRGFFPDDDEADEVLNQGATHVFNQQINIYADMDQKVKETRIADTIQILVDSKVIPAPIGNGGDGDAEEGS
jgi:hypothetical protein